MARNSTALALVAMLALLVLAYGGCGDDEDDQVTRDPGGDGTGDTAIDAREGNVARMGGVGYRVILFRELNANAEPDDALVDRPPADRHGYWAAFVEACNATDDEQVPTDRIRLETAFGRPFAPLRADNRYAYDPRPLPPGRCIPAPASPAARTFDGSALVFEVPFEAVQQRPLVLEIRPRMPASGAQRVRIELDL